MVKGVVEAYLQDVRWEGQAVGQQVTHTHGQDEGAGHAGFEPSVVHEEHDGVTHQTRHHQEQDVAEGGRKRFQKLSVFNTQKFFDVPL